MNMHSYPPVSEPASTRSNQDPQAGAGFSPVDWLSDKGPAFMAKQHDQQGNIALVDGSVECFSRAQLQDALKKTGDTGRTPGTFLPAIGATMGAGCNRIQLP